MYNTTYRIVDIPRPLPIPVVNDWLEQEIAQWVHYDGAATKKRHTTMLIGSVFFSRLRFSFLYLERKQNKKHTFYLLAMTRNVTVMNNPLILWKGHKWKLPILSQLARKRLCITASSVAYYQNVYLVQLETL